MHWISFPPFSLLWWHSFIKSKSLWMWKYSILTSVGFFSKISCFPATVVAVKRPVATVVLGRSGDIEKIDGRQGRGLERSRVLQQIQALSNHGSLGYLEYLVESDLWWAEGRASFFSQFQKDSISRAEYHWTPFLLARNPGKWPGKLVSGLNSRILLTAEMVGTADFIQLRFIILWKRRQRPRLGSELVYPSDKHLCLWSVSVREWGEQMRKED